MSWNVVLAPAFVAVIWSFLGATLCVSCCDEAGEQAAIDRSLSDPDNESRQLAASTEEALDDAFDRSAGDVELDEMTSPQLEEVRVQMERSHSGGEAEAKSLTLG